MKIYQKIKRETKPTTFTQFICLFKFNFYKIIKKLFFFRIFKPKKVIFAYDLKLIR